MVKWDLDISGGMNDALPATQIAANQCSVINNLDLSDVKQGATRRGYLPYNTTRFKDNSKAMRMLGLTNFAYGPGTFRDVFLGLASGESTKLFWMDGATATETSWATGITPGTLAYPFSFSTVRNHLIMTNGDHPNTSWDGDNTRAAQALGVGTPSAAPNVAQNAGGSNMTGIYRYVMVYYDSVSDVLGAASAVSASIEVSAKGVTVSNLVNTAEPRVDKKILYRTDGTGRPPFYYLATKLSADTSHADNVSDASLGGDPTASTQGELRAGGQPDLCRFSVSYDGVVYLMNSPIGEKYARVYASRPGRPEEFPASFQFDIGTGDGQQITGAWVIGNQLIVMKERSIWHVTGKDNNDRDIQQMDDVLGMRWPYSGVLIGSTLVFAAEDGLWTWDTARAEKIAGAQEVFQMQGTWDGIGNPDPGATFGQELRMAWLASRRQLWLAYSDGAQARNTNIIVWNPFQEGKPFSKYDFGFDCHGDWRENYASKKTLVFGTTDANGFVYKGDSGKCDRIPDGVQTNGTVGSANTTTLTIASGTLYTTGEGLVDVVLWTKSATTEVEQEVKIASNDSTVFTVAGWPTYTPAVGDTWAIGKIRTSFRTARLNLGRSQTTKDVNQLQVRMEARV